MRDRERSWAKDHFFFFLCFPFFLKEREEENKRSGFVFVCVSPVSTRFDCVFVGLRVVCLVFILLYLVKVVEERLEIVDWELRKWF